MTQTSQCYWERNLLLTLPERRGIPCQAGPQGTELGGVGRRKQEGRESLGCSLGGGFLGIGKAGWGKQFGIG